MFYGIVYRLLLQSVVDGLCSRNRERHSFWFSNSILICQVYPHYRLTTASIAFSAKEISSAIINKPLPLPEV